MTRYYLLPLGLFFLLLFAQQPIQAQPTSTPFVDTMDSYDTARWWKANGWTNGNPFNNGWRTDHVTHNNGIMRLTLDDQSCLAGCSNKPYASGEYRTTAFYGYGRFEVTMKAVKQDGVVSSFFTYTGSSDSNPHDEIDIEILGKDPTRMQTNYYTNGVGGHEKSVALGFDASEAFHTYAFEWSTTSIKWYVDGVLVHTEDGSNGALPTTPGKIMMNLWPGIGVDSWLNPFVYSMPIVAEYDRVEYAELPAYSVYVPIVVR